MRAVARTVDWRPGAAELNRVRCPTLVMFGTRDRIVWPAAAETYVRRIPGAWLEWAAGAGHVLPIERTDEVNEAVVAWARGVARDPDALRRPDGVPVADSWRASMRRG
jgi:pimeloyl-ACP methyl ester carboxylesterase